MALGYWWFGPNATEAEEVDDNHSFVVVVSVVVGPSETVASVVVAPSVTVERVVERPVGLIL